MISDMEYFIFNQRSYNITIMSRVENACALTTTCPEMQIDGRPVARGDYLFFPGDKVVHFTGPYGRPSLSVMIKTIKL